MNIGIFDLGDGGAEAKRWAKQHKARKVKKAKAIARAEDAAELKIRRAAYRAERRRRRKLGLSCKGLPPRINKSQIKDMTGKRFGRLTVVRMAPRSKSYGRNRACYVKCDCPRCGIHLVKASNLRQGILRSCGCLAIEAQRARKGEKRAKPLSVKMMIEAAKQRAAGNVRVARMLELAAPAVRKKEQRKVRVS